MVDDIYDYLLKDHQTVRALESSEVWRNYSRAEMARDQQKEKCAIEAKLDEENQLLKAIDDFRAKIATNPKLKDKLQKAAKALEEYPELRDKVDPNFINGLNLLDFEE